VLRLFPEEDYVRRPESDTREILRSDLSQLCLALRAMQIHDFDVTDWLDRRLWRHFKTPSRFSIA